MFKKAGLFWMTAVSLLSIGGVASAQTPDPVQRAYQVVVTNARAVMGLVYPTATSIRVEECRWQDAATGYAMFCEFAYTDLFDDRETRTLRFNLSDSRIESVQDAGGPSVIPPFATAGLTLEAMIAAMRQDMADHPDNYNDLDRAFLRALPDHPDPAVVLTWILNMRMPR